ncbi:MAG: hypothetical protein INF43_03475 [Alphaproteobacteria bacterium]|nr:hypothetical protein [Alphaproteobacteria bacterium]
MLGYARQNPTREEWQTTGKLLMLALPLLWVWSHNQVFMWDDFAHRLPSLVFVTTFDSLPRVGLPASFSDFPSYPYALTLLGLAVNRLLGYYNELAIAIVNGALLVSLAGFTAQLLTKPDKSPSWKVMAASLLAVTLLCPVFQGKLVASAYQDAALGWSLAVAWVLIYLLLKKKELPHWQATLAIGLTLALVTTLKQVGLVLAVMLVLPFIAWQTYQYRHSPHRVALFSILLMLPLILIWLAWRYYIATNIGGGEFSFLPWVQWQWHLWPDMLVSLGKVTVQKPFVVLPLLVVTGLTVVAWRKPKLANLKLSFLLASLVGWGYLVFLMVTYIGSFSEYEATRLASFSRYMQHVNWMLWLACLLAAKEVGLVQKFEKSHRAGYIALGLLFVPLAIPYHFIGKANAEAIQMRRLAKVLPDYLPANQNLVLRVEEPQGSGFRGKALQYYVGFGYRLQNGSTKFGGDTNSGQADGFLTLDAVDKPVTLQRCHANVCQTFTITLP